MPRKYHRRVFTIKIPSAARGDLERFVERLSKAIRSYGALLRINNDKLIIEIYGERSMIRESWTLIKRILSEYSRLGKSYPASLIYKDVGLAIPLDVLAEVLSLEGHKTSASKDELVSTAGYEEVLAVAHNIKEALNATKHVYATRSAKKLLVAAAAYTGLDPQRVAELALERGFMVMNEEGKLVLIKPWKEVLREFVGREGVEHG